LAPIARGSDTKGPEYAGDYDAMTRIGSPSTTAANAVGGAAASGGAPTTGSLAGTLMTALAGKMAQNIGSALRLAGNENSGAWQGNGNDPYEIDELVAELAKDVGGSPTDAGELNRALHAFVQESAALFAARPESRSLIQLQSVIANLSADAEKPTLSGLAQKVDAATHAIVAAA
jgi:hypothetical protein